MRKSERKKIKEFWKAILKRPGRVPQDLVEAFKNQVQEYKMNYNWKRERR